MRTALSCHLAATRHQSISVSIFSRMAVTDHRQQTTAIVEVQLKYMFYYPINSKIYHISRLFFRKTKWAFSIQKKKPQGNFTTTLHVALRGYINRACQGSQAMFGRCLDLWYLDSNAAIFLAPRNFTQTSLHRKNISAKEEMDQVPLSSEHCTR